MNPAWYALRRTIRPIGAEQSIKELVAFCRRNRVDEVMLKVDSEEFTHGLPSVQWLDDYMPVLRDGKEALTRAGVMFSINPWVTTVHCDRGRDARLVAPDIDLMVGHDGVKTKSCACPLSPAWRRHTSELWTRYASLEPHVLWIEDDIRLLNHQPIVYGCFCPLHMAEFSKRVGKDVSREELVQALLAPGEPHPYRKIWLDLNGDLMNEVARYFERLVHDVSPNTHLGLMCSMPNSHALEGRDWDGFVSALKGDGSVVARPCMCNYTEDSPRGLYESEFLFRSTLHCLGRDVTVQTELESWPFSLQSKSAKFTFLQCALSFVFGADGVTMNLFDHLGSPIDINPEYGRMLRKEKGFLNGLAARCKGMSASGVRLVHAANGSYHVRVEEGASWVDLQPEGQSWRTALEPMGIPVTYGESNVTALSGQVIRALSAEQIKEVFSNGALLDLTALRCALDMGYGDLVGVSINRLFRKYDEPLAAEQCFDEQFGGGERRFITLTIPDLGGDALMAVLDPAPGARVISQMVNPDEVPKYPFVTLYENRLGGRVAVYPVDIAEVAGPAFISNYRKEPLEAVMSWLSKDRLALIVSGGAYPLPFRLDAPSHSVIGTFNLSLDDWPGVKFTLPGVTQIPHKIESIDSKGNWNVEARAECTVTKSGLTVELRRPLRALSLTALTIS